MATTFNQLIAVNRRNTWVLVTLFSAFVVALAGTIGYALATMYWPDRVNAVTLQTVVAAAILTVILSLISYYAGGSAVLALSGAKPITHDDDPQLFNIVEEMALAAGLPMPKVYTIDDSAPNAFATGRDPQHAVVAVTTGLRQKLNRDELQGVVAHEMSHIGNNDILFAMMMAVLVGVVVLLCDVFRQALRFGPGRRSSRNKNDGAIVLIIIILAIIFSIIAPLIAKIIQLAVSRQREYLADASAVALTRNPDGLARALERISGDKEVLEVANRATQHLYIVNPIKSFEARADSVFSTHPPIADRIARIRSLHLTTPRA
jgi:heat shock protein HtpX